MTDQIVRAATPAQIAAAEEAARPKPVAKQVLPAGFEAEKTLTLCVPVEFNGTVYTEVSIRKLKGRDFIALQKMAGDEDVALLAIVSGLPAVVIEELDADDYIAITEASQRFLPRSFRAAAAPISADGRSSQP